MRIRISIPVLFILCILLLFTIAGKGQSIATEKVTVGLKGESLETAIKRIEQQSSFRFFYRNADIEPFARLNLAEDARTVEETLIDLLRNTPLCFRQMDSNVLLERKDSQASAEITGRIINGTDHTPIPNASIFLSNATIGDNTANDGAFSLKRIKPGKYDLVVSIIGFETYKQTISVNNINISLPDIVLFPKTIALKEVTIKPVIDPEWDRYYAWFKDEFLGTSNLASECKIINPEILDFDYNDTTQTLNASANDFLIIENRALGYKLKYLLTNFKYAMNKSEIQVHYEGSAFFESLAGTPSEQRRWQKKRRDVYQGSEMHFLRSALNNQTDEDVFRILRMERCVNPERPNDSLITAKVNHFKKEGYARRDSLAWWNKKAKLPKMLEKLLYDPLIKKDLVKPTDQEGLFAFSPGDSDDALYIMYNKYHQFSLRDSKDPNNTLISFKAPYVFFDVNGGVINPNSLTMDGAWGQSRVAELLPVDYEPSQNITAKTANAAPANNESRFSPVDLDALRQSLVKIKTMSDSISVNLPAEDLFMQFDKPGYSVGDTIWFKAYLFNESFLTASEKSGIIYVDVANDSSKIVKQYSMHVRYGLAWGNISLDEKEFLPGTYTIRAYTQWMRNFGTDYFFAKNFQVAGATENSWLVDKQIVASSSDSVVAKLQFSSLNRTPIANKNVHLQLTDGSRLLYQQVAQTDPNGLLSVNLKIPEKSSTLALKAESESRKATIPLRLNRIENADIQFLPEGGNLIAGLAAHIGFKATGEDGLGLDVEGVITNQAQQKVASFRSLHNGMGSFNLTIQNGETYTAKITLPGGGVKEYALPAIKETGMVLKVENRMEGDSLTVFVEATNDIIQSGDSYFLIGKARGIVCYGAIFNFHDGNYVKKKIAKNLFPSGITHFTIMDTKYRPLNERLVYIDKHDNFNIELIANKVNYAQRDSVALKLKVTDSSGDPVAANFSVAVTDDAQVVADSLKNENILSRILLTAGLKGYIESPAWYLGSQTKDAWQALDNLLLTQGWVGYDWKKVFNPPAFTYRSETSFAIKGKVVNVFNGPVKGTDVLLFSKSPMILVDTTTNKQGRFVFDRLPQVDTPIFIIKAVNKSGNSFNVGVEVDEVTPPEFTRSGSFLTDPWYVNSDTTLLNYTKNKTLLAEQNYKAQGHLLREVKISGKKIIKDSQNINGPGNADVVLDEKDLEKAGKKTWLQLFQENFKGLRIGSHKALSMQSVFQGPLPYEVITSKTSMCYYINFKIMRIIIDGTELTPDLLSIFAGVSLDPIKNLNYYLESHDAEEIKGIELNYSNKYTDRYGLVFGAGIDPPPFFVEITTRSGHGPFMDHTPGMYLYKPLAVSNPAQFYKPKYTVTDTARRAVDLRSTIDWEPNIITDKNGEATFSFYTADKPSTYSIIINGADMNGNLGFKTGKIRVINMDSSKEKAK